MSINPTVQPEPVEDEHLSLVQVGPSCRNGPPPLVLIHDGGGTSVSYFYLNSLDRQVYAIQNPRFYAAEPWEYGILEMAQVYADFILSVVPAGPLLLGGWSLGGLLSLEIASILAGHPSVRIVGIVMIDSICTYHAPKLNHNLTNYGPVFRDITLEDTRKLVAQNMRHAVTAVNNWIPPAFRACGDADLYLRRREIEKDFVSAIKEGKLAPSKNSTLTKLIYERYEDLVEGAAPDDGASPTRPRRLLQRSPPRTVLLRCLKQVPMTEPENPETTSRVDIMRKQEKLGWERYNDEMITAVFDLPGHHFEIFADEHIDDVTAKIKQACAILERGT
ncbi:hypothetical protein AJ80_03802 [Polytolypa hystricis UAMH7299]|uniref:Thioesterase domain-containing protein n=1 Tax=Polytolypa hystricis (strain UAMH7299) TaxID=1447883 RepID=A0A2B7YGB6_POLH7|nr:hypothetical protein AJ80_03802 [Polytolypa hystricis UAMH7299]